MNCDKKNEKNVDKVKNIMYSIICPSGTDE